MSATPLDVVRMLAEHELLIAALYEAYARRIEGCSGFWSCLAEEEVRHAGWLRSLGERAEAGGSLVTDDFRSQAIETSAAYLQEETVRADNGPVSQLAALSTALDVEEAMLEKRFFDVSPADSAGERDVLERLRRETEAHRGSIRAELEAERARQAREE